jgi:phage tail-like protein
MKKHTRREFLGKSLVGAIGAGAALSGLDALNLLAQKPARPMAGAQQMTADGRAFTAGRYAVLLDGGMAGWVQSVEGGHAAADVASAGIAQRKHIAGVKYEDITVSCGTGMSKPMYEWIKSSFDRKYMRKDGAIHTCDYDGNIVSTLEFFHGLITEVGFPALDAASKDAARMTIKISPETARMVEKRGGRLPAPGALNARQKKWLPANFRLEIAGLDCTRVNKVEAITIKQKVTENPVGEMRAVMKEPAKLEFPNLAFTVPEQNAAALVAWHKESAMRTRPGNHKPGKLVYLAADGRDPLFTLTFHNLGISQVTPDNSGAGSDGVRRLKAEMYCEKIDFEYGDAAVS